MCAGFGIYDAPEPWGPWTTVYRSEAVGRVAGRVVQHPDQMDGRRGEAPFTSCSPATIRFRCVRRRFRSLTKQIRSVRPASAGAGQAPAYLGALNT